ncbi:unnamed protein product [Didymodactylos carnosus]|uniref:Uncharacterized protein n=1 Tax=Didymodactylos carnosus TaxID=1234261 RepID=A0A813Z9Q6_9BILA|nr:unnamed protein product [Didymodactylos carnosus]CAF1577431.1 unnamed protein product [Didymodactylos carnosus]CAF3679258.1 unnamed protein product [Didymodactylos carnosus]CAF4375215.1 unnamed protein product [Didymodactylos carnosus]
MKYKNELHKKVNYVSGSMAQDRFQHILVPLTKRNLFVTPYKFFGTCDVRVTNWLKYLTDNFDVVSMSEEERLRIIHTFLCDEALLCYIKRKNDIETWSAFIEEMQKEYSMEEKHHRQDADGQRNFQRHVYHQQHVQRTYDQYSMETMIFEGTITVADSGELE